jgi:hypothetical protein
MRTATLFSVLGVACLTLAIITAVWVISSLRRDGLS